MRAPLKLVMCVVGLWAAAANAQSTDPAVVGKWGAPQPWPDKMVHAIGLPTGRILMVPHQDDPYEYDPATASFVKLPRVGYNLFCSGHSVMPDGKVLFTGGTIVDPDGLSDASYYNPYTKGWERLPEMRAGRYYPSNTTLSNGEVLVVGGSNEYGANNKIPEVWEPVSRSWRQLTGASFEIPNYYPWMFLIPGGRVFHAGPTPTSYLINTSGSGSVVALGRTKTNLWRSYGTAAMYEPGKVIVMSGASPPSPVSEVIDFNQSAPTWRLVGSMNKARRHHNATILPDGTVLVTGGSSDNGLNCTDRPVRDAELWDPVTEQFRLLAPAPSTRYYHSIAVLLDDGRVLTGGGKCNVTGEIYSPPYLFKGAQPRITSAPAVIRYGESFQVGSDDAASVAQVNLLGLNATTHGFDENQRICKLTFSRSASSVTADAPTDPTRCLPGHYRVFLINGAGVPSVARMVQLLPAGVPPSNGGVTPPPPPPPSPDAGVPATDGGTAAVDGVLFRDDFNRTSGLGSSWTVAYGGFLTDGDNALGTGSRSYAAWTGTPPADLSVEAELARPTASTYFGVFARGSSAAPDRDHYVAYLDPAGRVNIARRTAYSYTILATGPLLPAGNHVLRLHVKGSSPVTLTVSIDGAEILTGTDNSGARLLGGRAGIFDYNGGRQPLDAFVIRGAGSTAPPPPPPPDSGTFVDAGTPDAGVADAGMPAPPPATDGGTPQADPDFYDAFNRTGQLGPDWYVARGAFSVNGATTVGTTATSYAVWTGTPNPDSTIAIRVLPPTAATHYGLIARANPAAPDRDHYAAYVDPNGNVRLSRRDNYSYSYLGPPGPKLPAGDHRLTLTATGSSPVTLVVRIDGTEVIRYIDTSATAKTSGRAGIFDYSGRSQPLDDFTVQHPH